MSIMMLERAAQELAPFLDEVAFVGGATIVLWITDPAAPEPLRSHDLEDLIALVDGRAEIVDEVGDAPRDLRSFLSREIATLLDQPRFLDTVDGSVVGFGRRGSGSGSGDQDRVDDVFLPRLRALAGE